MALNIFETKIAQKMKEMGVERARIRFEGNLYGVRVRPIGGALEVAADWGSGFMRLKTTPIENQYKVQTAQGDWTKLVDAINGYDTIEPALIEKICALFNHEGHKYKPVQIRMSYRQGWGGAKAEPNSWCTKTVTTVVSTDQQNFTIRLEQRSAKGRTEYRSLKDQAVFLSRNDSVHGFTVAGSLKELVWFLHQDYRLTKAGKLQSCNNFVYGTGDWDMPCSDFYFVRAGSKPDGTSKMASKEMLAYIGDAKRFQVPQSIRERVLEMTQKPHRLDGKNEYLTIRRLFTEENREYATVNSELALVA